MELYLLTSYQDEAIRLTYFGDESDDPWDLQFTTQAQFNRKADKVIFQTTFWGNSEIGYIDLADDTVAYEPIRLTFDESMDVEPCFDPTGNWFCWASDRDGNYELYRQRVC